MYFLCWASFFLFAFRYSVLLIFFFLAPIGPLIICHFWMARLMCLWEWERERLLKCFITVESLWMGKNQADSVLFLDREMQVFWNVKTVESLWMGKHWADSFFFWLRNLTYKIPWNWNLCESAIWATCNTLFASPSSHETLMPIERKEIILYGYY